MEACQKFLPPEQAELLRKATANAGPSTAQVEEPPPPADAGGGAAAAAGGSF